MSSFKPYDASFQPGPFKNIPVDLFLLSLSSVCLDAGTHPVAALLLCLFVLLVNSRFYSAVWYCSVTFTFTSVSILLNYSK
jgi:hypothetical protein